MLPVSNCLSPLRPWTQALDIASPSSSTLTTVKKDLHVLSPKDDSQFSPYLTYNLQHLTYWYHSLLETCTSLVFQTPCAFHFPSNTQAIMLGLLHQLILVLPLGWITLGLFSSPPSWWPHPPLLWWLSSLYLQPKPLPRFLNPTAHPVCLRHVYVTVTLNVAYYANNDTFPPESAVVSPISVYDNSVSPAAQAQALESPSSPMPHGMGPHQHYQ